jgi:hypothetical protein
MMNEESGMMKAQIETLCRFHNSAFIIPDLVFRNPPLKGASSIGYTRL